MAAKKKAAGGASFDAEFSDVLMDPEDISRERMGYISTGSPAMDKALGGGIRGGTSVEISGPESIGKSTLAQAIAAYNIKTRCARVLYMDWEHKLDIGAPGAHKLTDAQARNVGWLQRLGIDPYDREHFQIMWPLDQRQMYRALCKAVLTDRFDIVVIDSVSAIVAPVEVDEGIGESLGKATYGAGAKGHSEGWRQLELAYGEALRNGAGRMVIFWINQLRANVGSPHGGSTTTGGRALPYYMSYRMRLISAGRDDGSDETRETMTKMSVKVEKNKFSTRRVFPLAISSEFGLDTPGEVLDFMLEHGYARKSGSWINFFDSPEDSDPVHKVQGAYAAKLHIKESGLFERFYALALDASEAEVNTDPEE